MKILRIFYYEPDRGRDIIYFMVPFLKETYLHGLGNVFSEGDYFSTIVESVEFLLGKKKRNCKVSFFKQFTWENIV